MSLQKGSPPTYTPQTVDRLEKGAYSFWGLFRSLPVVEAISKNVLNAYDSVKTTPVVGLGLRIMEGSCQSVLREVVHPYSDSLPARFLNDVACGFLYAVENNFEFVQKTPNEIGRDIQSTVNDGVEVFVQTFAGQFVLSGLELAVSASESALGVIDPRDEADDEIEPEETDGEATPGGRQTTIDELWGLKDEKKTENISFVYKWFKGVRGFIATPFHISTVLLKRIYNWLKNFDGTLDPEKRKEIEGRRKLTARRHYSNSLARRLLNALPPLRFLFIMAGLIDGHLRISKLLHVTGKESVDTSPVKSSNDRGTKRDYSECSNELVDFDADNYKSSEDEDYVQPSNVSTDSEEYNEAETESDIEEQLKQEQDSYGKPTTIKRTTNISTVAYKSTANNVKKTSTSSDGLLLDTAETKDATPTLTAATSDVRKNAWSIPAKDE